MTEQAGTPRGGLVERFVLPPEEIEARSLAVAESATRERFQDAWERFVAARVVYAAGDTSLVDRLIFSAGAVIAGVEALQQGATVVADVQMVVAGLDRRRLAALGCPLQCAIDDPSVAERARAADLPRAVEAMRTLAPRLQGAVVVIGNAPTALLSLLDLSDTFAIRPRLIVAMPAGFVAASEAKEELSRRSMPHISIAGTRGGSPLAAAAVNALLRLASPDLREMSHQNGGRTALLFAGHGSRAAGAAQAMLAAVDSVRRRGLFPVVETGYLELCQPDLPTALRACVEQGATRVLVVPYFLHNGMHIRRDIPAVLRRELAQYPDLRVSIGRPIGLHANFADVMIAGATETEGMPDLRDQPEFVASGGTTLLFDDDDDG